MENKIRFIVERLLGRRMEPKDGVTAAEITAVEQKLGVQLAPVLKAFYQCAGKEETVMDCFQHFAPLEELFIENDKLVFLEENQGACVWGLALNETGNDQAVVYQCPHPDDQWYAEDDALTAFLEMTLYYQFAQGGYEWMAGLYSGIDDEDIAAVLKDAQQWEAVVNQPGNLIIYWHRDTLVWYFPDKEGGVGETLFACSRTEEAFLEMEERYQFKEL
nr:SMI1/KNR4 family protein [uncultured Chitinophaga sp.]